MALVPGAIAVPKADRAAWSSANETIDNDNQNSNHNNANNHNTDNNTNHDSNNCITTVIIC